MDANSFPYTRDFEIVFGHLDVNRHVNNVAYLRFVETLRIEFMQEIFQYEGIQSAPIVIGDVYCRYVSPAFYHDVLTIGCGVSRFGNRSFDIVYRGDAQDGRCVIKGKCTLVCIDLETQRSAPLPESMKQKFIDFQAGWTFVEES